MHPNPLTLAPITLTPVTVAHGKGTVVLTGWQISPDLAVTPALHPSYTPAGALDTPGFTGLWAVTHLPTGLKVPAGSTGHTTACLHHARQFAHRLAATGLDWTRDRGTLAADPALRDLCRTTGHNFALCTHHTGCHDTHDDQAT